MCGFERREETFVLEVVFFFTFSITSLATELRVHTVDPTVKFLLSKLFV